MKPLRSLLSAVPVIAFAIVCLAGCAKQPVPAEQIAHIVLHRVMTYATEHADGALPIDLAATTAAPDERIPVGHTLAEAIYPAQRALRLRTADPGKSLVVIVPADGGGAYHGFLDGSVAFVPGGKGT